MPVASLNRVPLRNGVLEPAPPLRDMRAVLGVAGPVLGLDQPEALLRGEAETLGVVGELHHGARVGQGSDSGHRRPSEWARLSWS